MKSTNTPVVIVHVIGDAVVDVVVEEILL